MKNLRPAGEDEFNVGCRPKLQAISESLMVMVDGVRRGTLERKGKRLGFSFEPTWLEYPRRSPLFLSIPLALR
jgi:hypothetical protein